MSHPFPPVRTLLQHHGNGVFALDSGYVRERLDAIHIIVEAGRAIIVDTATAHSAPRVLAALEALGVPREAVDWIIVTHVHLDHAGGAGVLSRELPAARVAVHPRGARHLVDPARLWEATCAVYGTDEARRSQGEPLPVASDRVRQMQDGDALEWRGRVFTCHDAPGHARHHMVVFDSDTGHCFVGDTFGVSYAEFDVEGRPFVFPSSTPTQFDPTALRVSIDRILQMAPETVYLTHYSARRPVPAMGAALKRGLDAYEALADRAANLEEPQQLRFLEQGVSEWLLHAARAHGVRLADARILELLALDSTLNAAGIHAWMQARSRA